MTKHELMQRLCEIGVIYKKNVVLRSGETSDFYCDIKKAFGYPDILIALADHIGETLPASCSCIAASGYGGLPLASVVAARWNKKFIAVRSSAKDHGKGGLIDGYLPEKHDQVVIVDDVLTSGSSIRETHAILAEAGIDATSASVVVMRGTPALPIPYTAVCTIGELIEKAN